MCNVHLYHLSQWYIYTNLHNSPDSCVMLCSLLSQEICSVYMNIYKTINLSCVTNQIPNYLRKIKCKINVLRLLQTLEPKHSSIQQYCVCSKHK